MLERVRKILRSEAEAIASIPLSDSVERAIRAIQGCGGKVFTTGIGKAGYIAKKAASTFSTTGTPSVFLHPGDGPHGDVGVISKGDVLIALSNSGKTREVLETIHHSRALGISSVIAITGVHDSPIAQESDIVLEIGTIREACPFGLTPTSSTAAMMALTDALALSVMEERGFTRQDFAVRHHGGYLGKKSREE